MTFKVTRVQSEDTTVTSAVRPLVRASLCRGACYYTVAVCVYAASRDNNAVWLSYLVALS